VGGKERAGEKGGGETHEKGKGMGKASVARKKKEEEGKRGEGQTPGGVLKVGVRRKV